MSSVTAVPLMPIQKGSVSRFWFAMVVIVLAACVLAWLGLRQFGHTADGLRYQVIAPGAGNQPTKDDFALVSYKGTLPDGTVFDETGPTPMDLSTMIPGFSEAVTLMRRGGKLRVWIPADLAYGDKPPQGGKIPAGSPLTFEISLIEFKTRAEVMEMQRQAQIQQMMQQQQQQMGGGVGGPGAADGQMPPGHP